MAEHAMLSKFLKNGQVLDTADFPSVYQAIQPSCYEVIRVMGGKPLFLDAHYRRFVGTVTGIGQSVPCTKPSLAADIARLAELNDVKDYNVKLIYNDFENGGTVYLFFTHTSYPTETMYREGVRTDLLRMERSNPHAKIINQNLRVAADALMEAEGLFEAILVNEKEQITEGSKSNIFFIRGAGDAAAQSGGSPDVARSAASAAAEAAGPPAGEVWTSPADGVLLGVTRQRIIGLCRDAGLTVREEPIPVEALPEFRAAFISGTSPKVLPIRWIGPENGSETIELDVNDPVLRKIMALYDEAICSDLG